MDKKFRNLAVAALIVAAFGVGTPVGQDPTCAVFFGTAAVIGTVIFLLILTGFVLLVD